MMTKIMLFILLILPWPVFRGTKVMEKYDQRERCLFCHQDIVANKVVHKVLEEDCSVCHEEINSNHPEGGTGFKLTAEMPDLCLMCHDLGTAVNDHPPVLEDCTVCHSPHSSPYPNLILEDPVSTICYMCHEAPPENVISIHGPIEKGTCGQCHNPHKSDHPALLIREGQELCLDCHNRTLGTAEEPVANIAEQIRKGKIIHGALELGGCVVCHKPHSSVFTELLVDSYPESFYTEHPADDFGICFSCHDATIISEEESNGITAFSDGNKNLHFIHSGTDKARSCSLCHDPHASQALHLLINSVRFGSWEMKLNYTPDENGGSCAPACHAEESYHRTVPEP